MEGIASLAEFLGCQKRPSVIVDHGIPYDRVSRASTLVYHNAAFTAYAHQSSLNEKHFEIWATDPSIWVTVGDEKTKHATEYCGTPWDATPVGQRWIVLQSSSDPFALNCEEPAYRPRKRRRTASSDESSSATSRTMTPGTPSNQKFNGVEDSQCSLFTNPFTESLRASLHPMLDWTRYEGSSASPEFISFVRNFDWARTVLGPMNSWNAATRRYMTYMMMHVEPRCMYIGKAEDYSDLVMIYNGECAKLLGALHPTAFGAGGAISAGPAWQYKLASIKKVLQSGIPLQEYDYYFPIPRGDLPLEEAYFSWSIIPMLSDEGHPMGVLKEFWESTEKVVNKRRQKTVRDAEHMPQAENIAMFWGQVHQLITSNDKDFPFCLMYSAPKDSNPSKFGNSSVEDTIPGHLTLECTVGLNENNPLVVKELDMTDLSYTLTKQFRAAWVNRTPVLLRTSDHTLPEELAVTVPGRGHDVSCHSAVLYPISRLDGPGTVGFLLLGLNPQRPYDEPYREFIRRILDHLVRGAATVLFSETREELMQQMRQAKDQERQFSTLAELAPVGLSIVDPTGSPIWMNTEYRVLVNIRKDEGCSRGWRAPIHPVDRPRVEELFKNMVLSRRADSVCFHFRVQIDVSTPAEPDAPGKWRWLLATASSDLDEAGNVIRVTNFITDITPAKEAELQQGKRLEDALETKRQSENFIDMVCHEMRNPLSAIIQSADGIITAFDSAIPGNDGLSDPQSMDGIVQATVLDSAQTILLCAQHQKRIVDDILTLSKLDSNLLLIVPEPSRPTALVEKALQMYESELSDAGIVANFNVHDSYRELGLDVVLLDPARLLQVLINLLTNAIKFTRKADAKRISIALAASTTPPSSGASTVSFIPQRASRADTLSSYEWGKEKELYLQFDVCDTGKGLTAEELKRLFLKFSQASPKTYSQYGGSGLGLFISRELTELQGGQIGVHSIAGQGSTFAFYIKARQYRPDSPDEQLPMEDYCDEPARGVRPVKKSLSASLAYDDAARPEGQNGKLHPVHLPTDLHILLVEDNLINQKVTARQLRQIGCTVHVANNGLECLEFLEKCIYYQGNSKVTANSKEPETSPSSAHSIPLSVILLDQEMPLMDGLTCVRRIREMQTSGELAGHIPVIACTANARREQVAKALEAGMDDVVTKPFRIPDLLPRIYDLIQRVEISSRASDSSSRTQS
ncbi:hypothetical protein BCR34DRAFT_292356 [Clohesyomyces aquaticus]|uniref:Aerobic respiration control sensor protein arcB n=1 Tax=Clohesyomyces aquaticus TaxID=1231657 RepID=A0A1Y2A855_9PLEO|nr:hypothetical protein BCR34DRAFT_292356 [Clohesyomyces aquaticus]